METEYPIKHACIDCGAEVLQHDQELPPWVLWGPGWLCTDCKAKHDSEAETSMRTAGEKSRREAWQQEQDDKWNS